ncbi:MAG: hypothetical protein ABFS18_02140 [Thermodesulfobacteriota bacterium]
MPDLTDYRTAIDQEVPGEFGHVPEATWDRAIAKAMREHSQHRPRELVADLVGDGGFAYALDSLTDWEDDFSQVKQVEFPVDDSSETKDILEPEDWQIYQAPTGKELHFLRDWAAADESMRITYSARHTCTATACTVPGADEDAVMVLAAAYFCRALAASYSQDQDSTIAADQVEQGGKRRSYRNQAKDYEAEYYRHLGIKPGQAKPANVIQDMDVNYSDGGDRLTHPRRYR